MTLLRFKARNHPQQQRRDDVDDRWTPLHLWIPWHAEFAFTLDAAASADNHLCERYFTIEQDGLAQPWRGERVWVNPPFSAMRPWAEKARYEVSDNGCPLVAMLAPANRTEQRWWQETIEPYRDRGGILEARFLARRINFASPDNLGAWFPSSAPFGCVLLIWRAAPGETEQTPWSAPPCIGCGRDTAPRQVYCNRCRKALRIEGTGQGRRYGLRMMDSPEAECRA